MDTDSLTTQLQAIDNRKVVMCQYYLTNAWKMEGTCGVLEAF